MTEWHDDGMTGWHWWQDDVMTGWQDDQMTGWLDDKITRWQEASQTIDRMVYFLSGEVFKRVSLGEGSSRLLLLRLGMLMYVYRCQHWSPLEQGLSWAVADNEKHRYWPLLYYAAIAALTPIITSSSPYLHTAPHYHSTFFTFCRNSGQIFLSWEEDFNSSRRRYWTLEATPQLV